MAYETGLANTLEDLVSAIQSACTDNGWTLSGEVLHKDDIHVRIQVVGSTVTYLGGTGIDGGNELTGAGPNIVRMRAFEQAFVFPLTYDIHILTDPDEVYVIINYAVDFYQWAAWGQSTVEGLPGTGVWYAASCSAANSTSVSIVSSGGQLGQSVSGRHHVALLSTLTVSGGFNNTQNGYVQHGLGGENWNPANPTANDGLYGYSALAPLVALLPNTWNDETVLLPVVAYRARGSSKVSLVADLAHARHCRINYHDPGDIITFGSDRWRLYPCYRKDADNPGGGGTQHSGTLGFAVRYTGP